MSYRAMWDGTARTLPIGPDVHFAYAPVRPIADNDAPLIGERAATRGRSAMEGSDKHADAKRRYRPSCNLAHSGRTTGTRRIGGNSTAEAYAKTHHKTPSLRSGR